MGRQGLFLDEVSVFPLAPDMMVPMAQKRLIDILREHETTILPELTQKEREVLRMSMDESNRATREQILAAEKKYLSRLLDNRKK